MSLELSMRRVGDVIILDLRGRATIGPDNDSLSSHLRSLLDSGARKILLNLAELTQVDSSSICTIVRTFVTVQCAGGCLKLLNPRGRVQVVLGITRLLEVIPSFEDESKALASFRTAASGASS